MQHQVGCVLVLVIVVEMCVALVPTLAPRQLTGPFVVMTATSVIYIKREGEVHSVESLDLSPGRY